MYLFVVVTGFFSVQIVFTIVDDCSSENQIKIVIVRTETFLCAIQK